MATARYIIFELDKDAEPPRPAAGVVRGGMQRRSMGVAPLGRPAAAPRAASPAGAIKANTAEMSPAEAVAENKRSGVEVVRAMPIRLIKPLSEAVRPAAPPGPLAWGIGATGADASQLNGTGVTVAVLDTGLTKTKHAAFEGIDVVREDFTGAGDDAVDNDGHGTHCAGTIFGRAVNGTRIGVAPGVTRALIGKVLPDDRAGDCKMVVDALNWAARENAQIVSMSLGFDFPGMVRVLEEDDGMPKEVAVSKALELFMRTLRGFDSLMASLRINAGMLVVAAAGNESQRSQDKDFRIAASLPSAAEGMISVAAYGRKDQAYEVGEFSNINATICAPGVEILSASHTGGLTEMTGTSQACPHVAGLAALWWQKLGAVASPERVRQELLFSATKHNLPADFDETEYGRGRAMAPVN